MDRIYYLKCSKIADNIWIHLDRDRLCFGNGFDYWIRFWRVLQKKRPNLDGINHHKWLLLGVTSFFI